jgi:16S rRNA (guanine527-N7)-methyltransferase
MNDTITILQKEYNVSHETLSQLSAYHDLLLKWQTKLNLISANTIDDIWHRHILDSAQLCNYLPEQPSRILDVGSGAGFPAIILSILTKHEIHMVESDIRKCAFLRTVLSRVKVKAIIHECRLEEMPSIDPDIITARAFAPIPRLLHLTEQQHHKNLRFLLLKGREINSELINIDSWQKLQIINKHASITSEDGCILELEFTKSV